MNRPESWFAVAVVATCALAWTSASAAQEAVADSAAKYKFLGKTARDKDDHEGVVLYYTRLLRYDPGYRPAHYYLGRSLLETGHPKEAKRALLRSAALDSTHANTALSLYQVYAAEGVPDSAWIYLGRLLRSRPDDPRYQEYRRVVADLYRRQGEVAHAIEHYAALATGTVLPQAEREQLYEVLAVLYTDSGDAASALTWRQRLAGSDGAHRTDALAKMVDLQVQTEDYEGAFESLRELAQVDSAGRYSHFHRMSVLAEKVGDRRVRVEGLEGMARQQPGDAEVVATIVEIHLQDDELGPASRWIQRGLAQTPDDGHLRVLKGDLLARNGTEDSAIEEYNRALADKNWATVAQQRIWQLRPPETEEEKLKKSFFGGGSQGDKGGGS